MNHPYGNVPPHYSTQQRQQNPNYQGIPQQRAMNMMGQGPTPQAMGGRMPLTPHGQYPPHQQQQQHPQQLQHQQQQQQQPGLPRMQMSSMQQQQQQAQQQMRVPPSHQMNQPPSAQVHQQMPPAGGSTMGSSSMASQSAYHSAPQQQLPPPQQQQMPPPQKLPPIQPVLPILQAQLSPKKPDIEKVLERALNNRREAEFEMMFAQRYNDTRMEKKKKIPDPICLFPMPGYIPQRNDGRNRGRQDYKKGGGRKNDDRNFRY